MLDVVRGDGTQRLSALSNRTRIPPVSKRPSSPSEDPISNQPTGEGSGSGWRARLVQHRQEISFLALFFVLLVSGFALLAWTPVNDRLVEPFTAWIARTSGWILAAIGQDVAMQGTVIQSPKFAVNIRNGCNGVETLVIFCSAVLAFPASWASKLSGLVLGIVAIQIVNFLRVVALFLTGAYYPKFFDSSHTVIWQTVVILCGVLLWMYWAARFAQPAAPANAASDSPA